jgi:hypothetical protein
MLQGIEVDLTIFLRAIVDLEYSYGRAAFCWQLVLRGWGIEPATAA